MLNAELLPLHGDRVVLRAMRAEDASAYASGAADPAVRRYAHLPEPEYTEASVTGLIQGVFRDGLERGDLAVLTIADLATDAFTGSLVLFGVRRASAEVGFWVHPEHRGRGLAEAALDLAVALARGSGLHRLTARTLPENEASRRVLEVSGFVRGDTMRDVAPSGQEVAVVTYVREIGP